MSSRDSMTPERGARAAAELAVAPQRFQQDFELAERDKRFQAMQVHPESMAKIGYDPEAAKLAMAESPRMAIALGIFDEADESKDGALQWSEFMRAAGMMLKQRGMEDLMDSLQHFINSEFVTMDVDKSMGVDHAEFAAWYIRFHDWIDEQKLLREAGIETNTVAVVMPAAESSTQTLLAVLRHCKDFRSLKASGDLALSSVQLLAQLRKEKLTSVDFSGSTFSEGAARKTVDLSSSSSSSSSDDVQGGKIADMAIKSFAVYCPALVMLKLDGCNVSDDGMKAVAKNCPALRTVSVVGCRATPASLGLLNPACEVVGGVDAVEAESRRASFKPDPPRAGVPTLKDLHAPEAVQATKKKSSACALL